MFKRTLMSLALLASLASAENLKQAVDGYLKAAAPSEPWVVTGQFGFALTDGNSETLTVTAGIDGKKVFDPWTLTLNLTSLYAEDSGDQSANEHILTEKLTRALDEKSSIFQMLVLEHDDEEALHYRLLLTVGYERQLVKKEGYDLKGDIGGGVLHEEYRDDDNTEAIAQIGFTIVWEITKQLKYEGRLVFFPSLSEGGEFRALWSNKFTTPVSDRVDLQLLIVDKYNSNAPVGVEKNDILVVLTLKVSFTEPKKS
jgi:putative salt-induced outer membrane protein YdiY